MIACTGSDEDSAAADRIAELERRVAALEAGQAHSAERMADLDGRLQATEESASKTASAMPDKKQWSKEDVEQWTKDKDEAPESPEDSAARIADESGGNVSYVEHPAREAHAILVTPAEFVEGETPLIVSLHGFGGSAAYHAEFVPLHERVNSDGFALLLPNGALDANGNRFWNPTNECCDGGKSGGDDIAYLTELVAQAGKARDFGHIYFFGYSNGGFMAYHIACKGLPGLRAVASLAGTSYVEDTSCDGAPPVSALHVHGSADAAIRFDGDATAPNPKSDGATAFYAGAEEMVARWSRRAGCDWPEDPQPQSTLDLDLSAPGAETQVFRLESGCAEGISVELWVSEGSGHAPDYGSAFVDALLNWLLSQQ